MAIVAASADAATAASIRRTSPPSYLACPGSRVACAGYPSAGTCKRRPRRKLQCERAAPSTASSSPGKRASRSSRRSEFSRVVPSSRWRITPGLAQHPEVVGAGRLDHGQVEALAASAPRRAASAATICSRIGSLSACSTAASSISSRSGWRSARVAGSAVPRGRHGRGVAMPMALIVRRSSNFDTLFDSSSYCRHLEETHGAGPSTAQAPTPPRHAAAVPAWRSSW